jgi:amino acid transporter
MMKQADLTPLSAAPTGTNDLKRNALGLPSALAMSLAFISPTIGVIFISSLIGGQAGVASPFIFLLGTIGIALMAVTIAEFARRVTSAGGFYKFITLGLGNRAGFACGMVLLFAYVLQSPLNTNLFGGFVSQALLSDFGVYVPWWILMIAIVLLVGLLAWYSVHASMQFGIAFLIAEVAVAAVLLLLVVFRGGDGGQIPAAFTPTQAIHGWGGLGKAFVFIVLAFFGFESCLTVAEETRNPRRNLPIALVGSVTLAGLWFSFAMYAVVVGFGAKHIDKLAASSEPLRDLAVRYIGPWYGVVIDLAAFSAIIAVLLAIHTANFRVLYALGRDGLLPRALGRTHSVHKTPHVAIISYSIATLVIGLAAGMAWGPINAFGDLGYLSSIAMLPVYVLTNVALPVFVRKFYPSEFSPVVHVLFPIVSSAIFIVGIWLNIHPWPAEPMTSFPIIVLAVVVAAALWGVWLQRSGSPLFHQLGRVLFMEGDAQPHLEDVA